MDGTVSPEIPTSSTPTTEAELGVLGAQAARADRAARNRLSTPPGLGADPQDQHNRTRAIELAQGAYGLGIIPASEILATAESYYAFITGGTDGREG